MMKNNDAVIEKFIETKVLAQYRPLVEQFRALVKNDYPEITEEMRGGTKKYYGVPVYRLKRILVTVSPTKKGVTYAFSEGASFEDAYSLLEGEGTKSKNIRLSKQDDFDPAIMKYYLDQAVAIDSR